MENSVVPDGLIPEVERGNGVEVGYGNIRDKCGKQGQVTA